jgi:outer membrane protein assembly factor BamB
MSRPPNPLYIGTNRHVAALDPRTGAELWRTKLPHGGSAIVTLLIGKAYIFAGHAGHAYCLDQRLGSIIWENDLPKMGYNPMLLAMDPAQTREPKSLFVGTGRYVAGLHAQTGEELWRTRLPHGGSVIVSLLIGKAYLFVGHAGYLYALDKRLGSILWENGLPRMGFHPVVSAMEGAVGSSSAALAAGERAEQQQRAASAAAAGS